MPAAQRLVATVGQVVDHGERVYTVVLRPERPLPRFQAGQFLHLALDAYDPAGFWPDSRAFSIASPPGERNLVRITYSVHGAFSTRMEQELVEGRPVWIKMPYGDFVIDPSRDAVLFAGGTGITAFTAFLESAPAVNGTSVTLAYGTRSDRLLTYRDVVERCARRLRSLDAMYFVEEAGGATPASAVPMREGRVSVDAVWPRLRRPRDADYYLSGPPAMLRRIDEDLRARGIRPEAIHVDAWE